jgi:CDP-diacylglycerol--serine O-phosphatidyltransferase
MAIKSVMAEMKLKDYATLFGAFWGVLALIAAIYFHAYRYAGLFIFFGIIADLLDGWIARKMGQINEFGKQLDSLCDSFVFGVVPATVVYMIYTEPITDLGISGLPWYVMFGTGFIFMCGAFIRLAWFNVSKNEGYTGFPTPLSAGFMILAWELDYFARIAMGETTWFNYLMHYLMPFLLVFMAWLNVTNKVSYGKNIRKKAGRLKYILFTIGFLIIGLYGLSFIPDFGGAIYITIGIAILWAVSWLFVFLGFHGKNHSRLP